MFGAKQLVVDDAVFMLSPFRKELRSEGSIDHLLFPTDEFWSYLEMRRVQKTGSEKIQYSSQDIQVAANLCFEFEARFGYLIAEIRQTPGPYISSRRLNFTAKKDTVLDLLFLFRELTV